MHNPDGLMRAVQYRILTRILEKVQVPEYIYAFEKGRNIPTMAEAHVRQGVVVSIDLKDFFTSIKQHHLFNLFTDLGFGWKPATTLAELCTFKAFVPQGALTSPKLSNIITATTFGPELKKYCDDHGYVMTIYADDVTISARDDLVKQTGYAATQSIVEFVSTTVRKYGFKVNPEKTKVMRPFQRQYVCGVVVNSKINLQKTERNRLRAIVYNTRKNGVAIEAQKGGFTPDEFVSRIMGRLNWFSQLNPEAGDSLKSLFKLAVQDLGKPYAEGESVKEISSLGTLPTITETSTTTEVPWD